MPETHTHTHTLSRLIVSAKIFDPAQRELSVTAFLLTRERRIYSAAQWKKAIKIRPSWRKFHSTFLACKEQGSSAQAFLAISFEAPFPIFPFSSLRYQCVTENVFNVCITYIYIYILYIYERVDVAVVTLYKQKIRHYLFFCQKNINAHIYTYFFPGLGRSKECKKILKSFANNVIRNIVIFTYI